MLLERVFTEAEAAYALARPRPETHLAARFAAKEALMKALGTGWSEGVGFREIEVVNQESGAPELRLSGVAKQKIEQDGPVKLWVSLSHTNNHAMATVIVETTESA